MAENTADTIKIQPECEEEETPDNLRNSAQKSITKNLDDMKIEQLYMLEVLVNSIEVSKESSQMKFQKEDELPPLFARIKFIDFPCIEIGQNDFINQDENGDNKDILSDSSLKELKPENTADQDKGTSAKTDSKSSNLSKGSKSDSRIAKKIQKTLSKTDSIKGKRSASKLCVSVSTGKSCLFPMLPLELINQITRHPLAITVFRKNTKDPQAEPMMIGSCKIPFPKDFGTAITDAVYEDVQLPVTASTDTTGTLKNTLQDTTGRISVFIRLSCFGATIVTQFQLLGPGNEEYIFKSSKKDNLLEQQKKKDFLCNYNKGPYKSQNLVKPLVHKKDISPLKPIITTEENTRPIIPSINAYSNSPFKVVPWRKIIKDCGCCDDPDDCSKCSTGDNKITQNINNLDENCVKNDSGPSCPIEDCQCGKPSATITSTKENFINQIQYSGLETPCTKYLKQCANKYCTSPSLPCNPQSQSSSLKSPGNSQQTTQGIRQTPICSTILPSCNLQSPQVGSVSSQSKKFISQFRQSNSPPQRRNSLSSHNANTVHGISNQNPTKQNIIDSTGCRTCYMDSTGCYPIKPRNSNQHKFSTEGSEIHQLKYSNNTQNQHQLSCAQLPSTTLNQQQISSKYNSCLNSTNNNKLTHQCSTPKSQRNDINNCFFAELHVTPNHDLYNKLNINKSSIVDGTPAKNKPSDCTCYGTAAGSISQYVDQKQYSKLHNVGNLSVDQGQSQDVQMIGIEDIDGPSSSTDEERASQNHHQTDDFGGGDGNQQEYTPDKETEEPMNPEEPQEKEQEQDKQKSPQQTEEERINKLKTAKDLQRSRRRRKYRSIYHYTAGMYPGINIGHRYCIKDHRFVPKTMGWLWNTEDSGDGLRPRRGWKPGAINRTITRMIREGKLAAGLIVEEEKEQKSTKTSKRSRRPFTQRTGFVSSNKNSLEYEYNNPIKAPTLHVHKKDGAYFISMNPLKTESEEEEEEHTPLMFKILPHEDETSTSSESSLEIEFTAPGAVRKKSPKPTTEHIDTQYSDPESLVEIMPAQSQKGKKKVPVTPEPSSTMASIPKDNVWDADQPTQISKTKK